MRAMNHLGRSGAAGVLALLCLGIAGCSGYGSKVVHGDLEVYYTEGVTKEEADRLGPYLNERWKSAGGGRKSVQLKKAGDGYQLGMVVKKELHQDAATRMALEFDVARVSRDVFSGAAVELHMCDDRFNTVVTAPPRPDIRYGVVDGKVEVFFAALDHKADAEKLAKTAAGELQLKEASLKLVKQKAAVEVHVVIQQGLHDNPAVVKGWGQNAQALSARVFNKTPVEIHMCDSLLQVVRVVKP